MVGLCEKHAEENNLVFSTDPDPKKSKTMCIAFNCISRDQLSSIFMNDDILPWVPHAKHIGNHLHQDGTTDLDTRVKKGMFIQNAMELNQEFFFTDPITKIRVNNIYNSHYFGSPLWNLFGKGAIGIESRYNISVKVMLGFPLGTHRSLIEPLTGINHIKVPWATDGDLKFYFAEFHQETSSFHFC